MFLKIRNRLHEWEIPAKVSVGSWAIVHAINLHLLLNIQRFD